MRDGLSKLALLLSAAYFHEYLSLGSNKAEKTEQRPEERQHVILFTIKETHVNSAQ